MAKKSFEQSITELEDIVSKLEDGKTSLEDAVKLFENGMKEAKALQKMLEDAEKKVNILIADENGELKEEPFPGVEE